MTRPLHYNDGTRIAFHKEAIFLLFFIFFGALQHNIVEQEEHQDLPLEKIIAHLEIERSLQHAPLFQVVFAFYDARQSVQACGLDLNGLQTQLVERNSVGAKFDLSLEMMARGQEISGSLVFNSDLFTPDTIRAMAHSYQQLLRICLQQPNASVLASLTQLA